MNQFFRHEFQGFLTECRFIWMRQQRDPQFRVKCVIIIWFVPTIFLFFGFAGAVFSCPFIRTDTCDWLVSIIFVLLLSYSFATLLLLLIGAMLQLCYNYTSLCLKQVGNWWNEREQRRDKMVMEMNVMQKVALSGTHKDS